PLLRLQKWARRNPGKASSAVAATLLAIVGACALVIQSSARHRDLNQHLKQAEQSLAAADFTTALVEVERVHELAPDLATAVDLKGRIEAAKLAAEQDATKQTDLASAAEARSE